MLHSDGVGEGIIPPSEVWQHTQTVPGFIGGNPLLQKPPLPRTARVHMSRGNPLALCAGTIPAHSMSNEALSCVQSGNSGWSDEAHEIWALQDHFLKKSFCKPIGF